MWAVKEALEKTQAKKVIVYTDSQVVYNWVRRDWNNLNMFSDWHFKIKSAIKERKKEFVFFEINRIPREKNKAGKFLETLF